MRRAVSYFSDTFSPLSIRALRIYFFGQGISLLGTWMQITAQVWLVWELSHSSAALGIVGMLGLAPFLVVSPFAGSLADRYNRRKLLLILQTLAMAQAVVLALLVSFGVAKLWHVYGLAALLGCLDAISWPTQQAMVGDLVGTSNIRRTVLINNMIFQTCRMLGPAVAGWLIAVTTMSIAFWLNALSFLAVLWSLTAIRTEQKRSDRRDNPLMDFVETLKFVRTDTRIMNLFYLTMLITFFAFSSIQILSAYVSERLHSGSEMFGTLMGASGAGALLGSFAIAPAIQKAKRMGIALSCVAAWVGFWLCIVSLSSHMTLSATGMFMGGMGIPVVLTTISGFLQTMVEPNVRARLLSAWMVISFGIQPLASLAVGYYAHATSAATAIGLNGTLLVGGSLLLLIARPSFRTWAPAAG